MNELFAATTTAATDNTTGLFIAAACIGVIVLCLIVAVLSMQSSLKAIRMYLYVLMKSNVSDKDIKRLVHEYETSDPAEDSSKE